MSDQTNQVLKNNVPSAFLASVFSAPVSNTTQQELVGWEELCRRFQNDLVVLPDNSPKTKADHGQYFVRGVIKDQRDDDHLEACCLLILDVDEPLPDGILPTVEEIHDALGDIIHAVYPTITPGRSRIIVPVEAYHKDHAATLTRQLFDFCRSVGLEFDYAGESGVKSQPFFYGQCLEKDIYRCLINNDGYLFNPDPATPLPAALPPPTNTGGEGNHLADFTEELQTGTIHQAAKVYAGWLARTTNLSTKQIFDDITVLIERCCSNEDKVERWHHSERKLLEQWFTENVRPGFNVDEKDEEGKRNTKMLKERVTMLADQSPIDQEAGLKALSEEYKIPKSVLRDQLKENRTEQNGGNEIVTVIEPYNEEVDGATLVERIRSEIENRVILPVCVSLPIALWVMLSYTFESFRILPLLAVVSPEKRCGKTTLLEVLHGLCSKALMASNISPAAVYRTIARAYPTLLVDEADTFLPGNDELRGVINSGHTRASAFVVRVNGETLEPEKFATYCPKVIAMIVGKTAIPDTVADRSVIIQLRRKMSGERVKKLTLTFEDECLEIRQQCRRWADDNAEFLRAVDPDVPDVGNDRAADNWFPLLSISKVIGNDCYQSARDAMLQVFGHIDEGETIGTRLLRDIKDIFTERSVQQIASDNLVQALTSISDAPWSEYGRNGKPITQKKLADLLRGFDIRPRTIRIGEKTTKGYRVDWFDDAFKRYLPPAPLLQTVTPSQIRNNGHLADFRNVTEADGVTDGKPPMSLFNGNCYDVTDQTPPPGPESVKTPFSRPTAGGWEVLI